MPRTLRTWTRSGQLFTWWPFDTQPPEHDRLPPVELHRRYRFSPARREATSDVQNRLHRTGPSGRFGGVRCGCPLLTWPALPRRCGWKPKRTKMGREEAELGAPPSVSGLVSGKAEQHRATSGPIVKHCGQAWIGGQAEPGSNVEPPISVSRWVYHSQSTPWDCQSGLPRNGQGWWLKRGSM